MIFLVSKRCIPIDWQSFLGSLTSIGVNETAIVESVENLEIIAKINGVGRKMKSLCGGVLFRPLVNVPFHSLDLLLFSL